MEIGEAVAALKSGKKISRKGWNGKGMWVKMFQPSCMGDQMQSTCLGTSYADTPTFLAFPVLKTAGNAAIPWLCSITDMLAEDWYVVE